MSLNSTIQAFHLLFSAKLWGDLVSLYSRQSAPYTYIKNIFWIKPILYIFLLSTCAVYYITSCITSGWESWKCQQWLYLIKFFHLHFKSHHCTKIPLGWKKLIAFIKYSKKRVTSSVMSDIWDQNMLYCCYIFPFRATKRAYRSCQSCAVLLAINLREKRTWPFLYMSSLTKYSNDRLYRLTLHWCIMKIIAFWSYFEPILGL